ncbi:MAG TPA: MoxR family ATPase [Ktedonobacterales bacterium]|jgi:MoxR-like ATPase|nr:MoxR family ATPase [Ktedonobacterales bacterium]
MTPTALAAFLEQLVSHQIRFSTMIWGPPGVGKSSIVAQTARAHALAFVDVRLSQLAPTDLRGLPVAAKGVSRWYPPEFLPREGVGILFLDEVNLAPPTMQGMAQQLILDRRVGNYQVPDGWFIWAAGNRKEDRAAVYDMPAPLANRFVHLSVEPDFESFKAYALAAGVEEQILAFLSFRPELLHKLDAQQPAWPSPRSWMMASALHHVGLDIAVVVGQGTAAEFDAYRALYEQLPDIERILAGAGEPIAFPEEPSVRYATTIGLTVRAANAQQSYQAFRWLTDRAGPEWSQLFASDLFRLARARDEVGSLVLLAQRDPQLKRYLQEYLDLLGE